MDEAVTYCPGGTTGVHAEREEGKALVAGDRFARPVLQRQPAGVQVGHRLHFDSQRRHRSVGETI